MHRDFSDLIERHVAGIQLGWLDKRLIEAAFPLKQVSLDSVHEKNVRHGHISTLHIWPARRPLAASRAALLATLLPDPGSRDARRKLLERMAGRVVEAPSAGGERMKEETRTGSSTGGREGSGELARFREEIREAFGGRAPRVLDPFAGGGGDSAGSDAARVRGGGGGHQPGGVVHPALHASLSEVAGRGDAAVTGVRVG